MTKQKKKFKVENKIKKRNHITLEKMLLHDAIGNYIKSQLLWYPILILCHLWQFQALLQNYWRR